MRSLIVLLLSFGCITLFSCNKGELPEAVYYSKVHVYNLSFPNSPDIDVRFEGKSLGSVDVNRDQTFDVKTSKGKLQIYKADTDTLLLDTLLTLLPNQQQELRLAYSKELGLAGFISAGREIPSDTLAFQVLNNLGDFYKPYTNVDLHICFLNYETGEIDETGYVVKDFTHAKLAPQVFMVPYSTPDGFTNIYVGKLWDNEKGEFIIQPNAGVDFFIFSEEYGGAQIIYNIQDVDGDITPTSIRF